MIRAEASSENLAYMPLSLFSAQQDFESLHASLDAFSTKVESDDVPERGRGTPVFKVKQHCVQYWDN